MYTTPNIEQLRIYYAEAIPHLYFLGENGNARTKELQSEVELLKSERNAILERLNKLEKFYNMLAEIRIEFRLSQSRSGGISNLMIGFCCLRKHKFRFIEEITFRRLKKSDKYLVYALVQLRWSPDKKDY